MKPLLINLAIALLIFAFAPVRAEDVLPVEIADGVPRSKMMSEWLKQKAMRALDRREARFEELQSAESLKAWQDQRRHFFRRQIGEFPERSPLNAKVTGTILCDGYRIEKLYFESQPGLHVTANLYLPEGTGRFPAVLHPTGHSANAKNRELYQLASITIAKAGCAVLCYDPIGQGERQQLFKGDGTPYPSTVQHTFINQASHLLGSNVAQTMIWDGMRAIDYLQGRDDIDPDKIGCTGISGGGTNTSYLMALDDRITAAAPGCYLTGYRKLLNTIGPQDAEQNIHGQLAFGMDHADYILMRLPKPTLIMAATEDYFDIEGAWDLFRQGKRFATRQGFPERVDLVEPDTKHGFPPEMRLAAANWMRRWLLELDKPITEGELKAQTEQELNATPTGRVLDLDGAKTILEINAALNDSYAAARDDHAKSENRSGLLEQVRALIVARKLTDLPKPKVTPRGSGIVIEPEDGILIPARLVGAPKSQTWTILLDGAGMASTIETGRAKAIADKHQSRVLVADLRGLGETKAAGGGSLGEFFGADWKDTHAASLLGITYVGMRAEDIWQLVRVCRRQAGNPDLKPRLVAIGEPAIPALHAAALQPELFSAVEISRCIESWTDVVNSPLVRNQQTNLVYGALRVYDLPILRETLGAKLSMSNTIHPDGTPNQ